MVNIEVEECWYCLEPINNPICTQCFQKEVLAWLKTMNGNSNIKRKVMRALNETFSFDSINETKCIICGENTISVCIYCYFSKVKLRLEKIGIEEEILGVFSHNFNYEIH